jgi:cytochrome oxidase Cu insertion factor (SCO1/SenC/PrrC family)
MVAAQSLSNAYHAFASREGNWKDKDYQISHSGEIFLIAPDGRIKLVYSGEHLRADEMQQDLERLMIQTGER